MKIQTLSESALCNGSRGSMRQSLLRAFCAVAEGAALVSGDALGGAESECIVAVLRDAQSRVCVLGGRVGLRRSLASVWGGAITLFLGGLRGVITRVISSPVLKNCISHGMDLTNDGSVLLVSDYLLDAIHAFRVSDGAHLDTIGTGGTGALQFSRPRQVSVAPDDFVFVADSGNQRIQILSPQLHFECFVGLGILLCPMGVCANTTCIAVAESFGGVITIFNRTDGARIWQFYCDPPCTPVALCFTASGRHVVAAGGCNCRVSVYTLQGKFERRVGDGKLGETSSVVYSAHEELVVADTFKGRIVVFSNTGDETKTVECGGPVQGVTLCGGTIYAFIYKKGCVVIE